MECIYFQVFLDKRKALCGYPQFHFNMALVAMIPPTFSTFVHAHHWWHFERVENGGLGRLKTLPFLCCQAWPSFRYAQLLYIGLIRKDGKLREEKEYLDKELSSVEPFVESMWQVIIIGGYRQMEPFCINHILNPSYPSLPQDIKTR